MVRRKYVSRVVRPELLAKLLLPAVQGVAADPLGAGFPTITNDPSGARSYPKGATEVNARTIKPKEKKLDQKGMRVTGIPGFNFFGTPSSKQAPGEGKIGLF